MVLFRKGGASKAQEAKFWDASPVYGGVKPQPFSVQLCDVPHMGLAEILTGYVVAGDAGVLEQQLEGVGIAAADGLPVPQGAHRSVGLVGKFTLSE